VYRMDAASYMTNYYKNCGLLPRPKLPADP
jgi:hypothetical protein